MFSPRMWTSQSLHISDFFFLFFLHPVTAWIWLFTAYTLSENRQIACGEPERHIRRDAPWETANCSYASTISSCPEVWIATEGSDSAAERTTRHAWKADFKNTLFCFSVQDLASAPGLVQSAYHNSGELLNYNEEFLRGCLICQWQWQWQWEVALLTNSVVCLEMNELPAKFKSLIEKSKCLWGDVFFSFHFFLLFFLKLMAESPHVALHHSPWISPALRKGKPNSANLHFYS